MNSLFPSFANDTRVIVQPNSCFVYSRSLNRFDIFNYASLVFFNLFNGVNAYDEIVSLVCNQYPEASRTVVESDLRKLIKCLCEKQFLTLNVVPKENQSYFELTENSDKVKIVLADIELTKNCNLSCKYCYNESSMGFEDIPLEKWQEILSSLHSKGLRAIKISGGEPFLYKNIKELLCFCSDRFIVTINSNGYFISANASEWLADIDLQTIQISIDSSTEKIHDFYRGTGSWRKAISAIKTLSQKKIPTRISSTLTTSNIDEIGKIGAIAKEYEAEFNFEMMKPVGNALSLEDSMYCSETVAIAMCNSKEGVRKYLDEMEIACQAQLGIVGISHAGLIKPCNLTEGFFKKVSVDFIPANTGSFHYHDSDILKLTDKASKKVASLLESNEISTRTKCIFEY